MKNNAISILFLLFTVIVVAQGCKKDKLPDEGSIDEIVYELATETNNIKWYKNSDQLLNSGPNTGHSEDFLRTRFNATAATMLNDTGKVMENAIFPDGSVIVKELHSDQNTLATYAVMYKDANNEHADATGWVWGYFRKNGEVRETAENKGSACRSCHLQSGNIDLTLMNKDHP